MPSSWPMRVFLTLALTLACASGAWCEDRAAKPIRVGIIGLDTSHVTAFTQLLNDPKAGGELAGVKVVAAFPGGSPDVPSSWDRVKGYTADVQKLGVEIVPSIDELLKKVDAVLLESVDGRPHLAQARPVIAAGKPLFIDKPMAGSLADVLTIFELAKAAGVPCFSSSSLRFCADVPAVRGGTSPVGKAQSVLAWGPYHVEPHHPDLFWYGVHGVELLYAIMGPGCKTVTRAAPNKVVGQWADGRQGTYLGKDAYGAEVEGPGGKATVGKFDGYKPLVVEICKFFRTGKAPVAAEETIELFAFMEAADESKRQGGAPVTIESVLAKARRAAAAPKTIRVGIIGMDAHALPWTQIINGPAVSGELAEMRIVAGYPGGSPDIPASMEILHNSVEPIRKLGVEIVDSIDQLLPKVDAVLLLSIDGRPHLAQARPVFAARKPVFIDKPVAASLADAITIFRLAKESGVPCFTSSALRMAPATRAVRSDPNLGEIRGCDAFSPAAIEPHQPDFFWYGIHGVEALYAVMGPGCESVSRTHAPNSDVAVGLWQGGRIGTFRGTREGPHTYGATVFGLKGIASVGKFEGYEPLLVQIVRFFKTGKPPVSAEESLEVLAFMEAADHSKRQGGCPVTLSSVMEKAQKAAAAAK